MNPLLRKTVYRTVCCLTLTASLACHADEWRTFTLDSGVTLRLRDEMPHRTIPYLYVEQGIETVAAIGKQQVLTSRRIGFLGGDRSISYSLIAVADKTTASEVEISGLVSFENRAWMYKTFVNVDNWREAILIVLEALSRLPNEAAMEKSASAPDALFENPAR